MQVNLTPTSRLRYQILRRLAILPDSNMDGSSELGLTLIECLMAIVVIAITIVAISPPIMLATGTRIQSRRIEMANQIAQGEIDRVRSIVESSAYTLKTLPIDAATNELKTVAVAQGNPVSNPLQSPAECAGNTRYPDPDTTKDPVPVDKLVRVDVDGDCQADFMMQVFRTTGQPAAPNTPVSFDMGVRVYMYYPTDAQTFPTLSKERASAAMTSRQRDREVSVRYPMAVLYSNISRTDLPTSLCALSKKAGYDKDSCDD